MTERPWVINAWAPLGVAGMICWLLLSAVAFFLSFTTPGYVLFEAGCFVLLLSGVSLFAGLRGPVRVLSLIVFAAGALSTAAMLQDNLTRLID
ncbi:MAG TPA: hypothetical protein VFB90_01185 [Dehalococcoidia bacterium]|nr:hypothetical protein [Dehalococcoidia bacterium]